MTNESPEDTLLALHAKTTKGRWTHFAYVDESQYLIGVGPITRFSPHGSMDSDSNAAFIVAAHNQVPALCEKVKRLEAALQEAINVFDVMADDVPVARPARKNGFF